MMSSFPCGFGFISLLISSVSQQPRRTSTNSTPTANDNAIAVIANEQQGKLLSLSVAPKPAHKSSPLAVSDERKALSI